MIQDGHATSFRDANPREPIPPPMEHAPPNGQRRPQGFPNRRQLHEAHLSPAAAAQARYIGDMNCGGVPFADSSCRRMHVDWDRQRWLPNHQESVSAAASGAAETSNENWLLQRIAHDGQSSDRRHQHQDATLTSTERYAEAITKPQAVALAVADWQQGGGGAKMEMQGWKGCYSDSRNTNSRYTTLCNAFVKADSDQSGQLSHPELMHLLLENLPGPEAHALAAKLKRSLGTLIPYDQFARFLVVRLALTCFTIFADAAPDAAAESSFVRRKKVWCSPSIRPHLKHLFPACL